MEEVVVAPITLSTGMIVSGIILAATFVVFGVIANGFVIAVAVMMLAAGPISRFVEAHPTVKILALSFLLLIGMSLVAESFEVHIPKGYIYFAMGFSIFVEAINLRIRRRKPVHLRARYSEKEKRETP